MDQDHTRLWFVSDIHASQACFRKFLNLHKNRNSPNVLIVGGDITGKHLIVIVERSRNQYSVESVAGSRLVGRDEVPEIRQQFENAGCYVFECDAIQFAQMQFDEESWKSVFDRLAKERLKEWVALADEKLPTPDRCLVFMNAGNDDPLYVDEILDSSRRMVRPEGKVCDLPGGMKLLSTGYSNMSPWHCPRDLTEEQLKAKIVQITKALGPREMRRAIFNFHCPPKNTHLDLAPALDSRYRKIAGPKGAAMQHVGSTAVREAIKRFQPVAALHGHIHTSAGEDRIGRTMCFNPGSDYASGALQGFFLVFDPEGNLLFHHPTSEQQGLPRPPAQAGLIEGALEGFYTPFRRLRENRRDQARPGIEDARP